MAGFRPDLDLSDFIEDYADWLDGRDQVVQRAGPSLYDADFERPISVATTRVNRGPITCSTSTVLDIPNRIIWDVNGYYRALGVDPRATRSQLREAFHEVNGGNSEYLTYVLQQLLDSDFREEYDRQQLGSYYIDKFIAYDLKMKAMKEAIKRSLVTGEVDAERVMDEMGYKIVKHTEGEDDHHERQTPIYIPEQESWDWGYFLHKVSCYDIDRLRTWQQMLISALSEVGVTMQIAVGFAVQKDTLPIAWTQIEEASIMVAYLGARTTPTRELADQIAQKITA